MQASRTRRLRPSHAQAGVVLIEALVAMLIFVIGVLGIVGLQASMTHAQTSAKFRGDASYLATQLVGTMWGDIPNLGNYGTGQCDAYARCSDWKLKVAEVLPGGSIDVVVATGLVTVTITWTVPNEGQHSYATSTAIRT